jgi:uncharacterized protein (TIGR03437 family)
VLALNEDNTVNSATNPAALGSVIQLIATGPGPVTGAPADGQAPSGQVPTADTPRVIMGIGYVDDTAYTGEQGNHIQYSGLMPGLVGVWQVNVRIPKAVAPDKAVVVVITFKGINSNGSDPARVTTTIAVKQ